MSNLHIDWSVVSRHLKCPKCGEPASISPESDGHEGFHTHRFPLTRQHAAELTAKYGKPSYEQLEQRVKELEAALYGSETGEYK